MKLVYGPSQKNSNLWVIDMSGDFEDFDRGYFVQCVENILFDLSRPSVIAYNLKEITRMNHNVFGTLIGAHAHANRKGVKDYIVEPRGDIKGLIQRLGIDIKIPITSIDNILLELEAKKVQPQ